MISRRDFLAAGGALAALLGSSAYGGWSRLMAQQRLSAEDLLAFTPKGTVTLLHIADLHAQLLPTYYKEPLLNLGAGGVADRVPHLSGEAFLERYQLQSKSAAAYAMTGLDFAALAKAYGKMGGLDRMARIVEHIRESRPGATLLLDSGDSWQGSYTSLQTRGQDVIDVMAHLMPDAMTGHWEFTYGAGRLESAIKTLGFPFLAGNVIDTSWEEAVFPSTAFFERGGVKIAVIGQAFPYTPIANPRHFIPDWSFGIRQGRVQRHIDEARAKGAGLVVLLSHNGFDVDVKMAGALRGLDVILTGHTHDALPEVFQVNKTLLVASGSAGKFISRLDLDVGKNGIQDFAYRLIPIFSDVFDSAPSVLSEIEKQRAPYQAALSKVHGQTEGLLYRRGTFNGTFDDLICDALLSEMEAEIALSPGFRWGTSLLPGAEITGEDLFAQTAITYPACYRRDMTGAQIKAVLEDVADNLFHEDPYYAQGGDMVRVGGLGFFINLQGKAGARISDLRLLPGGAPLEAGTIYKVAGWASVAEGLEGPPVWEIVSRYLKGLPGVYRPGERRAIIWQ